MKNYKVYHKKESGAPELHKNGEWFFEPEDWNEGEVFSEGYATKGEAEEAAEKWALQAALEDSE